MMTSMVQSTIWHIIVPMWRHALYVMKPLIESILGKSGTIIPNGDKDSHEGLFASAWGGIKSIMGFANGTDNAPGGLSLVGENGPELMNVPRGAQIIPSAPTLSMMAGGSSVANFGDTNIIVHGNADNTALRLMSTMLTADKKQRYSEFTEHMFKYRRLNPLSSF
jgi:hypothetical protein